MIVGDNVALGSILPVDLPKIFAWFDDPANVNFSEPYIPRNLVQQEQFWTNAANDPSRLFLSIRTRPNLDLIGTVQIMAIEPIHRSAKLGILIGDPAQRGRGFGREAMKLAVDYCWSQINVSRISLQVFDDNLAAISIYEALGFEHEGVLRDALFVAGKWVSLKMMAIHHPARRQ